MKFIHHLLTDRFVAKMFWRAGINYGDMLSYAFMGKSVGFDRAKKQYEYWKKEYVRRGFLAPPIKEFIDAGGYGKCIDHLFMVKK